MHIRHFKVSNNITPRNSNSLILIFHPCLHHTHTQIFFTVADYAVEFQIKIKLNKIKKKTQQQQKTHKIQNQIGTKETTLSNYFRYVLLVFFFSSVSSLLIDFHELF